VGMTPKWPNPAIERTPMIQIEHSIGAYPHFVAFRAESFSRLRQLLLNADFQAPDK